MPEKVLVKLAVIKKKKTYKFDAKVTVTGISGN